MLDLHRTMKARDRIPLEQILKSLGDPVRLSIVRQLLHAGNHEIACGCFDYDVAKATFSHHMAVLADLSTKGPAELEALRGAAAMRGVELSIFPVAGPEEIAVAIDKAQAAGATALNVLASPIPHNNRKIILDRSAALRLPAIYQWPETAEEGGLAAYGPRFTKVNRQLARQLVKLLHGAKPADIPVEQPTEFELVINLKTAEALGLTIPPSILLLADEVIE